MDVRIWRKVLLQWITECNFMEHNYFNIEQTNIDAFYQKFCTQHKIASKYSNLKSLLQTHYPEFKPDVDDENVLSSAEYIYVYSLLLHFCCVKYPEEHFHIICQKLSEQVQQSIAVFFKQLMEYSTINRENISQAIAEVGDPTLAVQQQKYETISSSSSITSSNGLNGTDLQTSFSTSSLRLHIESPLSTPSRRKAISAGQRISPDTPKSSLLEERTRELYNYKALLETERYEKSMLELQITQNEKQIESMIQVHKNLQQQIQDLKDELLAKSIDPNISDHEDDETIEAVRRQLCKKINDKEQENYRLFDTISTLREEKTLLESKLRLAESKLLSYRDCIQELELKMEELTAELQKKDITIKTLTDDKADLEHFIAETRSASGSSRPNFDTSVDCLDASFSRYTNSSGSLGSPENLGTSVVDIQLREKEHENTQLREELTELRARQKELVKFIQLKTHSYMQEYAFELNNNANMNGNKENCDLAYCFNSYVDCMNHLGKSYKDAKNEIKKLENDIFNTTSKNNELNQRVEDFEDEINQLRENLKAVEAKNNAYLSEIENLQQLKQELATNYDNSVNDYEKRLEQSNFAHDELKKLYEILTEHVNTMELSKINLEKQIEELSRQSQSFETECINLREKTTQQTAKLQSHMEAERLVKENYEKSLIELEDLKKKLRESDAHMETMRQNIYSKEVELGKLGKEIVQLGCTNVALEEKVNKLTHDYKHECSKRDDEIQQLKIEQLESQKSLDKLQKELDSMTSGNEIAVNKLEIICELLNMTIGDIDIITCLDGINYAVKKLLSEQQQNIEQLKQFELEKLNLMKQYELEIESLNEHLIADEKKIEAFTVTNEKHEIIIKDLNTEIVEAKKTIELMKLENQSLEAEKFKLLENQQQVESSWLDKQQQLENELKNSVLEIQKLQTEKIALEKEMQQALDLKSKLNDEMKELTTEKVILLEKKQEAEESWLNKQQQLENELKNSVAEIQKLQTDKIALEKEMQQALDVKSKLNDKLKELTTEVKNLKAEKVILLEKQQVAEKSWLNKQQQLESELKNSVLEIQKLQTEKVALEKEMQQALDVKSKLNDELKELTTEVKSLKAEKVILLEKQQVAEKRWLNKQQQLEIELSSEKQKLALETQNFHNEKTALLEKQQQAELSWLNKQQQLEAELKGEKEIAALKTNELFQAKKELQVSIETIQKIKIEFETQELQLKQQISLEKKARAELKTELETLNTKKAALKTKISDLELNNQKLETESKLNAKKTSEAIKLFEACKLKLQAAEKTLENLQIKKNELEANLNAEKKFKQELEAKLTNFDLKVKELMNENERLISEIQTFKDEHETTAARLLKADETIKKLALQLEKTNEMITARNLKLEESQQMLTLASEKLENKAEMLKSLQATCDKQTTELQQLQTKCEQQCKQVKSLKQTKNELLEKCELLTKELANKTNLLQIAEKENLEKEAHIKEIMNLKNDTETRLQAVNNDSLKLQSEFVVKETELQKLKTELTTLQNIANEIEQALNLTNFNDLLQTLSAINTQQPNIFKLKTALNLLIQKLQLLLENEQQMKKLQTQFVELNKKFQNEVSANELLNTEKTTLARKLKTTENNLHSDLQNLEAVNEKLSEENSALQLIISNKETDLKTIQNQFDMLKDLNEQLSEANKTLDERHKETLEAMKTQEKILNDKLIAKDLANKELQKLYDELQIEATEAETAALQRLKKVENELQQLKEIELAQKIAECVELKKKCYNFETINTEIEAKMTQLKKDGISLRVEFAELHEKYQRLNDEVNAYSNQLEAANLERTANCDKLNEMHVKQQKIEREKQTLQTQLNEANVEIKALENKQQQYLNEKQKIIEELNAKKHENHELQSLINDLKQKNALSILEKEDLQRQIELLNTQVQVNRSYQTTSESKLKNIIETSQKLERNLLTSENTLKTMRATLEQSKTNAEKLDNENRKLRENAETLSKRLEKFAFKLGDSQAQSSKLVRENEKLNKQLEICNENLETLQRDKDLLQIECKTLKERLNKSERSQEQNLQKLQTAEQTNATLMAAKKTLETNEVDLKAKIRKIDNARQACEERLRKLTQDNERSEREMVNLNHQIGALNTEIQTLKHTAKVEEKSTKIAELNKALNDANQRCENYQQSQQALEKRHIEIKQQLENVTDKLSKTVLALEISKRANDELNTELKETTMKLQKIETVKLELEQAHKSLTERLKDSQNFSDELLKHKRGLEAELAAAQTQLVEKNTMLTALRLELNDVRLSSVECNATINEKSSALVAEVESLHARLKAKEEMLAKAQEITAKLRLDNQILQAKYHEAKLHIKTETESTEERIKENRLELEGKLEKMKNKMKALYTEEVSKMKAKQEREIAVLKSELDALKADNVKYEEHTRKLSAELMGLNDRMLECQKENTYLLTKLQYIQNDGTNNKFKRPNTSNVVPSSSSCALSRIPSTQSIHTNIGTDLAMEDEEGEIFNNTYLTDLKNGIIATDVCPEELMHRNSLLPPHLKSSYAPQYDHGLCEDEVKDGQSHSLDDSTSVLITNNTSCTRKKVSGVTHYRKPGPPTPSKNGGRLSFGGSCEPAREILKESYDGNFHGGSTKTPARFGFLKPRFSLGNSVSRDEHQAHAQEHKQHVQQQAAQMQIQTPNCSNVQDFRRAIYKRNFDKKNSESIERMSSVTKILTSTPRTTKSRNCLLQKRRLIKKLQKTASTTSRFEYDGNEITPPEISIIETPPELNIIKMPSPVKCARRRISNVGNKRTKAVKSDSTRSSIGIKLAELQRRIRKRVRRERPSICVQKNIYASKYCTPQRSVQRDLNRYMGRRDRRKNFDQQRGLLNTSRDNTTDSDEEKQRQSFKTDNATYDLMKSDDDYDNKGSYDKDTESDFEVSEAQSIDGATYNINKQKEFQSDTVIMQSKEEEVNTTFDNQTISHVNSNKQKTQNSTNQIIISTELQSFNKEIEQLQSTFFGETYSSNAHFEELLRQTASDAPFKVDSLNLSPNKNIQCEIEAIKADMTTTTTKTTTTKNNSQKIKNKHSNSQNSNSLAPASLHITPSSTSQNSQNVHECVTPTPHCSTSISPSKSVADIRKSLLHHSRTIYGASVIFNRRIPNVDAVQVRKSSIYFKNPKCSTFRASCNMNAKEHSLAIQTSSGLSQDGDLILLTDQTITLYDLICMWQQMSLGTRIFVCSTLMGFIAVILILIFLLF